MDFCARGFGKLSFPHVPDIIDVSIFRKYHEYRNKTSSLFVEYRNKKVVLNRVVWYDVGVKIPFAPYIISCGNKRKEFLMTTSLQYFMLIAKEQSIIRAAEQLYISPQNLSNHMKRLEKEYGTLFIRYPHFCLTPAGEALYQTLQQISILEQGLHSKLKEIEEETLGQLNIGIHPTRARILLPRILKNFLADFPGVYVNFHYQNMITNEKMLRNGEIDAFFGVDVPFAPEFKIIPLENEPIYFVASTNILKSRGVKPEGGVIFPKALTAFPFLLSPNDSRIRKNINMFCDNAGISLSESVTISDYELQLILASQDLGVCFSPKTVLTKMRELNHIMPPDNQLEAFRVNGLDVTNTLSIVVHKLAFLTKPLNGFIQAFQEEFQKGF